MRGRLLCLNPRLIRAGLRSSLLATLPLSILYNNNYYYIIYCIPYLILALPNRFAHTPPPLSLILLFPEPTVVQVLFKGSSVVLLLLLTPTTLFSP